MYLFLFSCTISVAPIVVRKLFSRIEMFSLMLGRAGLGDNCWMAFKSALSCIKNTFNVFFAFLE